MARKGISQALGWLGFGNKEERKQAAARQQAADAYQDEQDEILRATKEREREQAAAEERRRQEEAARQREEDRRRREEQAARQRQADAYQEEQNAILKATKEREREAAAKAEQERADKEKQFREAGYAANQAYAPNAEQETFWSEYQKEMARREEQAALDEKKRIDDIAKQAYEDFLPYREQELSGIWADQYLKDRAATEKALEARNNGTWVKPEPKEKEEPEKPAEKAETEKPKTGWDSFNEWDEEEEGVDETPGEDKKPLEDVIATVKGSVKNGRETPDDDALYKGYERRREELMKELDTLKQNEGYLYDPEAALENVARQKEINAELARLDKVLGNPARYYDEGEALAGVVRSWLDRTEGSYANALGTVAALAGEQDELGRAIADSSMAGYVTDPLAEEQARQAAANGQLDSLGILEQNQAITDATQGFADEKLAASNAELEKVKEGLDPVDSAIVDMAMGAMDLVADAGTNLVIPGGGLTSMAIRVFGQAAAEAREKGMNVSQQLLAGLKSAAIEVFTEKIGGPFEKVYGKTFTGKIVNEAIDKLSSTPLGRRAIGLASDFLSEGFEEVLSNVLNVAADKLFKLDPNAKINWGEALYEGLIGGLLGLAGGGLRGFSGPQINAAVSQVMDSVIKNQTQNQNQNQTQSTPLTTSPAGLAQEVTDSGTGNPLADTVIQAQNQQKPLITTPQGTAVPVTDSGTGTANPLAEATIAAQNQQPTQRTQGIAGTAQEVTDSGTGTVAVSEEAQNFAKSLSQGPTAVADNNTGTSEAAKQAMAEQAAAEAYQRSIDEANAAAAARVQAELEQQGIDAYNQSMEDARAAAEQRAQEEAQQQAQQAAIAAYNQVMAGPTAVTDSGTGTANPLADAVIEAQNQQNDTTAQDYLDMRDENGWQTAEAQEAESAANTEQNTDVEQEGMNIPPTEENADTDVSEELNTAVQLAQNGATPFQIYQATNGKLVLTDDGSIRDVNTGEIVYQKPAVTDQGLPQANIEFQEGQQTVPTPNTEQNLNQPEQPGMKRSQTESHTLTDMATKMGGTQEPLYYPPITEQQTITEAVNRVNAGINNEVQFLMGKEMWSAGDIDTGLTIYGMLKADAIRTGDSSAANAWAKVVQSRGTRSGQALQAFSKWTRSGTGQATAAAEELDKWEAEHANDNLTPEQKDERAKDLTARKNKIMDFGRELDNTADGDLTSIRDIIKQQSDYRGTGTFADENFSKVLDQIDDYDYLREYATRQLFAIAEDATVDASLGQKVKTWQVSAQLTRLSTFFRNIGGNVLFGVQDTMTQDGLGVAIDWLVSKATGRRTVGVDKNWFSSAARKGARDAMLRSILEVAGDVNMSDNTNRYGMNANRTNKMNGSGMERFMSRWEQLLGYSLTTSDQTSRGQIEAAIRESLRNSGLTEEEINAIAEQTADYRLFQNKGKAYKISKGVHDILNLIGFGGEIRGAGRQGGFGLGDIIMPYPGVPANLGVKALEYSPANILKGGVELYNVLQNAKMGNYDAAAQNRAVMDIARGMAGTPIIALLAAMLKSGIVRNWDDEDDKDVKAQNAAEGKTGVQINMSAWKRAMDGKSADWRDGDEMLSIGWLEPMNAFMAIASNIASEEGDLTAETLADDYFSGAIQAVMDIPTMSGLKGVIDAYNYSTAQSVAGKVGDAAVNLLGNGAGGLVPAPISQAAKTSDLYYRDPYADSKAQTALNNVLNNIPGLRQTLPVKTDNWGNPKEYSDSAVQRFLNNFVLPGAINELNQTGTSSAIEDLYERTKDAGVYPDRKAPTSFSQDGVKYKMDKEEQRLYHNVYGQTAESLISSFVNSKEYKQMKDAERAEVIKNYYTMAKNTAKSAVMRQRDGKAGAVDPVTALLDIGYSDKKAASTVMTISGGDGKISQDELKNYYAQHPGDEKVIAALWNAAGFTGKTTATWDLYKASLKGGSGSSGGSNKSGTQKKKGRQW